MVEVRRLSSKKMAEKMVETEEKSAEVRKFICRKMADTEDKASEMAREMRRKTCCIKAEMKKVKAEVYECLSRDREKVKHE